MIERTLLFCGWGSVVVVPVVLPTVNVSSKLTNGHQPASTAFAEAVFVCEQIFPSCTALGSEGVGVVDNYYCLSATCDELETWTPLLSQGGGAEGNGAGYDGKQHFYFQENTLQHFDELSVTSFIEETGVSIWRTGRRKSVGATLFLGGNPWGCQPASR